MKSLAELSEAQRQSLQSEYLAWIGTRVKAGQTVESRNTELRAARLISEGAQTIEDRFEKNYAGYVVPVERQSMAGAPDLKALRVGVYTGANACWPHGHGIVRRSCAGTGNAIVRSAASYSECKTTLRIGGEKADSTVPSLSRRTPFRRLRLDMAPVSWDDHEMQSMLGPGEGRSAGPTGGHGRRLSASVLSLAGLLFVASTTPGLGIAQTGTPRRTVWDGVYTEAQASRGTMAYGQSCAGCHALATEGRSPLVGEAFWKSFAQKNVGDLLEFVSTYMPNGTPGSLSKSAYEDIVALILKSNGFPAGTAELGSNTIAGVQIVAKDGRTELPANALVRVVGCLARSGADWVVTNATAPERAERVATVREDSARPLGGRKMALKFVVTRLDSLAGSRVSVTGLLIGDDGVDGLNVTAVNHVAPACP